MVSTTLSAFSENRTNTIVPTYVVNDAAKNRDGAKTECRFRYTTKLGTPELAFASPFYVPTCVTGTCIAPYIDFLAIDRAIPH